MASHKEQQQPVSLYHPGPTAPDLSILDPELRLFINVFPLTNETATEPETVVEFMRAIPPRPYLEDRIDTVEVTVSVPGFKGWSIPGTSTVEEQPPTTIRVWIPSEKSGSKRRAAGEKFPVMIFMHHGGFFSSGPSRLDPFSSAIALDADIIVIVPAFRQTPENPYPAPYNDTYQVLQWLADPAILEPTTLFNIDKSKIAVGGVSAGGTLAAGFCLQHRDELARLHQNQNSNPDTNLTSKSKSPIKLLILDDASMLHTPSIPYDDARTTYSTKHNPINKLWNANVTRFMWHLYLPTSALEKLSFPERGYVVPAEYRDEDGPGVDGDGDGDGKGKGLRGLPPTLVLTAQWDDLTNDAIKFAGRLLEAGVPTEIHNYRGTFHVSDKLIHDTKTGARKRADIVAALRAVFDD